MITLKKFSKYAATIELKGFQVIATSNQVAEKLQEVGFTNVEVRGTGKYRQATGVWSKETQEQDLPKGITDVVEL
jgi:hypothetical protein